ncbi:MAG: peptide chain release factor 1 [archaeon]|nr:peptide chain release factor 1 [archaeon]
MIERLELIEKRMNEIDGLLMDPSVLSDIKKSMELSKERANIIDSYEAYQKYKKILSDLEEAKELKDDPEMGEFAREEISNLTAQKEELEHEIEILLIPKDENDGKNVVMEIRGAAGGDEGNIFAGDLFRMYQKYIENNGWKLEIVDASEGAAGGFAQIEFIVKGDNVYSKLKYESGSHRVQRVPETEANGRIQTSTATVLVMPEIDDVSIDINPNDLRIDVYCASGHGGQGVNTTPSAVRITHIPTNTVVTCQNERSQIQNKEQAMKVLRARLFDAKQRAQDEAVGADRKSKIGTGDRSEKIRTYNYPQNRVTDHRIGFTTNNLDRVMDGDLEQVIQALITEDQKRKLSGTEE